jgi:hypothetical protein
VPVSQNKILELLSKSPEKRDFFSAEGIRKLNIFFKQLENWNENIPATVGAFSRFSKGNLVDKILNNIRVMT